MTFKHVKFEDSPTMRALEKVAREKGLVKPETLTKKASVVKKADLSPTDNLMENILKLCNGLREQGLVKDAADLETKYLQYKQAQTMYDATGETGEDLLDQAHPEGSHKLENVDSKEAVVEDLLDKHDMIEEVAEKKPQAKLSDAASVIKAVKKVLAQNPQPQYVDWTPEEVAADWAKFPDKWKNWVSNQLAERAYGAYQRAAQSMAKIQLAMKQHKQEQTDQEHQTWALYEHTNWLGDLGRALQKANDLVRGMRNNKEVTVAGLDQMIEAFNEAKGIVADNVTDAGVKEGADLDLQGGIQLANELKAPVNAWLQDQSRIPTGIPFPKKPAAAPGSALMERVQALEDKIDYYAQQLDNLRYNDAAKKQGKGYLANWRSQLETIGGYANKESLREENEARLKVLTDRVNTFYNDWIKGK